MAWNEPGNNNQQDPWGGKKNDGPPDLDEALKKFQDRLNGVFGGGSGGGSSQGSGMGLFGILLVVIVLIWAALGVYQLDEQEKAVVLRFGAFKEVVGPGLHWNPKIIDKVYKQNVTKARTHTTRGSMLTEDENIVEVELSVQYNIFDLQQYFLKIRSPETTLREATDSALRHVVGSSKMDEVLTIGREKIAIDVKARLIEYLNAYSTGIKVITVNVENNRPPDAVQEAFDDVIKAREDEQRVQNEAQAYANQVVPEARGRAKRILQEAQAYRDEIIARSEGEADRFVKLLTEYKKAPEVTRERLYLDTIQLVMEKSSKVMMDVEGGNNMMYLPLDKLNAASQIPLVPGQGVISQSDLDAVAQQIYERLRRELDTSSMRRKGGLR